MFLWQGPVQRSDPFGANVKIAIDRVNPSATGLDIDNIRNMIINDVSNFAGMSVFTSIPDQIQNENTPERKDRDIANYYKKNHLSQLCAIKQELINLCQRNNGSNQWKQAYSDRAKTILSYLNK